MKEYNAGLYLRLSHEDIEDNNSIEAQRVITREYAIKHKYNIVDEYVDNGYSGMLDSRPALNRMIVDILMFIFMCYNILKTYPTPGHHKGGNS